MLTWFKSFWLNTMHILTGTFQTIQFIHAGSIVKRKANLLLNKLWENFSNGSKILPFKSTHQERRILYTGSDYQVLQMITNRKLTKHSVKITLRINKTKTALAKCLTEAMKQLETDGKICNEYSCICQQQYPNCPLMEITE